MKKVLSFISIITIGLTINNKVKAEGTEFVTVVDDVNYSIDVKATYGASGKLTLKLNGAENITDEDINYYVYFSNSANTVPTDKVTIDALGCDIYYSFSDYNKFKLVLNSEIIDIDDDWYMLNNYNYAYVVKQTYTSESGYYCSFSSKPIEVKQPELPELNERYQYYIFSNKKTLSTFPAFPKLGERGSHKITTKIGLINNKDLLKKLSKSESGSLEELISYAKENDGTSWTYSDSNEYDIDTSNFNIVDGAYYYIYTTYDNSEGYYRDLSGITVVMGESGMLVNDLIWDDENISTTSEEPKKEESKKEEKKEEIKNPKTGIEKPYFIATIFIVIAGIGLIILKNKKVFSK